MDLDDLEPQAQIIDPFQENLDDMSLEELAKRIVALKQEIARCEAMITSKNSSLDSAEAVFR